MSWKSVTVISSAGDPYSDIGQTTNDLLTQSEADGFRVIRWHQDVDVGISREEIKEKYAILKKEARSKSQRKGSLRQSYFLI